MGVIPPTRKQERIYLCDDTVAVAAAAGDDDDDDETAPYVSV